MKKILLFSFIAILTFSRSGYAQSSVGLIAHWPFSGNANDSSVNGHNGMMHNVTPAAGVNGVPGTAIQFAGDSSSYINVPNSTAFNLDSFSICAWLKPTGFYNDTCQTSMILSRGDDQASGHYSLLLFDNAFDSSCSIRDTNNFVFATKANNNNGYNHAQWQYSPRTHTNQWYSVVATFKGSVVKIYINGTLVNTVTVNTIGPIDSGSQGIYIGKMPANTQYPYWFKGIMDDLRLYNRPLTAAEVTQYNKLGVDDKPMNKIDVGISPNPGKGSFVLAGDINTNEPIHIEVYNSIGQIVYTKIVTVNNGHLSEKIELNEAPNGLYVVRINTVDESRSLKLSLQR